MPQICQTHPSIIHTVQFCVEYCQVISNWYCVLCVISLIFSIFVILDYAHRRILWCDGQSRKDYRFPFRENTTNPIIPHMGQGGRYYYFIVKCFWTAVYFDVLESFQCRKHSFMSEFFLILIQLEPGRHCVVFTTHVWKVGSASHVFPCSQNHEIRKKDMKRNWKNEGQTIC